MMLIGEPQSGGLNDAGKITYNNHRGGVLKFKSSTGVLACTAYAATVMMSPAFATTPLIMTTGIKNIWRCLQLMGFKVTMQRIGQPVHTQNNGLD
jgi:hypothetical protein